MVEHATLEIVFNSSLEPKDHTNHSNTNTKKGSTSHKWCNEKNIKAMYLGLWQAEPGGLINN